MTSKGKNNARLTGWTVYVPPFRGEAAKGWGTRAKAKAMQDLRGGLLRPTLRKSARMGHPSVCASQKEKQRQGCRVASKRAALGVYSWWRATMGSRREALMAGRRPEMMPTAARIRNETSMMVGEARRKMSPSWLAV